LEEHAKPGEERSRGRGHFVTSIPSGKERGVMKREENAGKLAGAGKRPGVTKRLAQVKTEFDRQEFQKRRSRWTTGSTDESYPDANWGSSPSRRGGKGVRVGLKCGEEGRIEQSMGGGGRCSTGGG